MAGRAFTAVSAVNNYQTCHILIAKALRGLELTLALERCEFRGVLDIGHMSV